MTCVFTFVRVFYFSVFLIYLSHSHTSYLSIFQSMKHFLFDMYLAITYVCLGQYSLKPCWEMFMSISSSYDKFRVRDPCTQLLRWKAYILNFVKYSWDIRKSWSSTNFLYSTHVHVWFNRSLVDCKMVISNSLFTSTYNYFEFTLQYILSLHKPWTCNAIVIDRAIDFVCYKLERTPACG